MYYTHVNRQVIARNKKHGTDLPAVRFQKGKYGRSTYARKVRFKNGVIQYKPDGKPLLPCGARLVIVTKERPEVLA